MTLGTSTTSEQASCSGAAGQHIIGFCAFLLLLLLFGYSLVRLGAAFCFLDFVVLLSLCLFFEEELQVAWVGRGSERPWRRERV